MHSEPQSAIALPSSDQADDGAKPTRSNLGRVLVGYFLAYAAFEGSAQLAASLDLTWRQIVIALAGFSAALVVQVLLFRQSPHRALVRLGLGRPTMWSLLAALGISGVL